MSGTILVVDDSSVIRQLVGRALRGAGGLEFLEAVLLIATAQKLTEAA
jgi:CheY-like chemotaxis protein